MTPGILLFVLSAAAFAQPASFDVASVRPSKFTNAEGNKGKEGVEISPGSVTLRSITLTTCLRWAYAVKDFQISGPGWLSSERYDIAAKAAGPVPEEQMKPMLQALLVERFHLALHREHRDLQVYALVTGKTPPKLDLSKPDAEMGAHLSGSMLRFPGMSMAQLADLLTRQMDRPVLDMTGLTGRYNLTIDLSSTADGSEGPAADKVKREFATNLPAIVQQQLGLKIEPRKLPADILIIDHVDKVPTEN